MAEFTVVGLNSCDRDSMAHKAENIYYLALCRESLLTPALDLIKHVLSLVVLLEFPPSGHWIWYPLY